MKYAANPRQSLEQWFEKYCAVYWRDAEMRVVFDLCAKMLTFDKTERPSAATLLQDPFLASLNMEEAKRGLVPNKLKNDPNLLANEMSMRRKLTSFN